MPKNGHDRQLLREERCSLLVREGYVLDRVFLMLEIVGVMVDVGGEKEVWTRG